ncbi:DUF1080 domain-containing protein [Zhouia sp. PK063]|uniref:DUF1080 domain-containing protein n=1 Tax=Zhouia sp. PK063 TaxID=3373602 RepID=UPI0037B6AA40
MSLVLVSALLLMSCKSQKDTVKSTTTTSEKDTAMMATQKDTLTKANGWRPLFDGKTFDGWHGYNANKISSEWTIQDGVMVLVPSDHPDGGRNLVTDKNYTDFILTLDWKVGEGSNSGFFWGVKEDKKYGEPYQTGPEVQILDDERHPDAKNGISHQAGALYDMIGISKPVTKPAGQWNTCMLEVNHKTNTGKIWLNGVEVVNFPVEGDGWKKLVDNSKFKNWDGFAQYPTGKIGLQFHGGAVSFKNIKIKELN